MIRPGFETIDPRTLCRMVVVEGAEETGGRGFTIEVHCPEGAPPAVLEHLHASWTETFEIVEGEAAYRNDGIDGRVRKGESFVTPPGVPHIHPWNTAAGEMVYRLTSDFGRVDPDAIHDVIGTIATLHGLGREGRLNARGLPKHPLQFAATLRTLIRHGGFDASKPAAAQKLLAATVGRLAEALGYRGVHERYITRY